jgi:RNA polymerase sigma-70 factor, ECF subfamily
VDSSDDAELVRRARGGDADAFCRLVRRHERTMLALAYARTRCAATAADVVQDSVVRCWKKLPDLREESKFAGWLATTVRHLSVNALRSPQRRMRLAGGDDRLAQQAVPDGSEQVADADLANALRAAIDALDEPNAAVLVLKYYEDLSSKEIAAVLEMTPAAVDMRLTRARQALRASLAGSDIANEMAMTAEARVQR